MANELGATALDVIIPEVWEKEIQMARYSEAVGDQVARVAIANIEKFGDTFHLPYFPRVTINNVGATDGSVTNQTVTLLEGQLLINQWQECTVEIVDKSGLQSILGDPRLLAQRFAQEFGPALREKTDKTLFAEQSNVTTNVVGDANNPGDFSDALARAAMQKLDESRIPKSNRAFVLSPKALYDLFGQDRFASALMLGTKAGVQMDGAQTLSRLYGANWFETAEVAVSGSVDKNLLLHRDALALGLQRNVQVLILAKTALTTRINANVLYGTKTVREDHACVINTLT